MDAFDQLGVSVTDIIGPWIAILISIVVAFWFKDFAINLMQGLKLKFNPAFNEGDSVVLDGQDAIVVKIGLRESVFDVYSDKGYTWRYVPNNRIPYLKLEKIVNSELHLDSKGDKGRRIKQLLDEAQNQRIETNANDIKDLKKRKK